MSTDLRQLLGVATNEPEFLDVDEAFRLDIKANSPQTLSAHFTIAPGYYLYQDKLSFLSVGNPALADYNLPDGKTKHDPYFGDVAIYSADFAVDLALAGGAGSKEMGVDVSYQGCAEKGICYPPVKKSFTIALPQLIRRRCRSHTNRSTRTRTRKRRRHDIGQRTRRLPGRGLWHRTAAEFLPHASCR